MYLLDTNVVSEELKPEPHAAVRAWMAKTALTQTYLSVMTLGEIRQGIAQHIAQNGGHTRRSIELDVWLNTRLLPRFEGRVFDVDQAVVVRWGQLVGAHKASGRPLSVIDALIAATALHHNMTLVTRNVAHMQGLGVTLLNPWDTRSA